MGQTTDEGATVSRPDEVVEADGGKEQLARAAAHDSYAMGQCAADMVYADADPTERGALVKLDRRLRRLRYATKYLRPDDEVEWLEGYNLRMDELMQE